MNAKQPPSVSIQTIHFRGISRAAEHGPSAGRGIDAARPQRRPKARNASAGIKFAGIGGGGKTLPVITAREIDPAEARMSRQRQIDALLDQTSAASGITKPAPTDHLGAETPHRPKARNEFAGIKFTGIGGGSAAGPADTELARQRQINTFLDQISVAAGFTKPRRA